MKKHQKKNISIIFLCTLLILLAGLHFCLKHTPTVSVIMSTYNRADLFLPRAIDSILNQTYKDFEFIIIDDGSTDKTPEVLKQYQQKDSRIVIITNKTNEGVTLSINKGFDRARGKYIARMDDDDISLPKRFEKQVAYMDTHTDIALMGTGRYLLGNDPNKILFPHTAKEDSDVVQVDTLFYTSLCQPTWMMRRQFIEDKKIRYNPEYESAEDRRFLIDVLFAGGKMIGVRDILFANALGKSSKKKGYYKKQYKANKKATQYAFSKFFPNENIDELLKLPDCEFYQKLFDANARLKLISQNDIKRRRNQFCTKNGSTRQVKHPYWSDKMIVTDTWGCRTSKKDCGKIVNQNNQEFTIIWDCCSWETFKKQEDGSWVLKK